MSVDAVNCLGKFNKCTWVSFLIKNPLTMSKNEPIQCDWCSYLFEEKNKVDYLSSTLFSDTHLSLVWK